MTLVDDEPGKVRNGSLATVIFRAEDVGSSNLTVFDCILVGLYSQDHDITDRSKSPKKNDKSFVR